jgi:hypothetical protein
MTSRKEKAAASDRITTEKGAAGTRSKALSDDPCRCKEVSVMTPKQLLGTMLGDLAFWKKKRKE